MANFLIQAQNLLLFFAFYKSSLKPVVIFFFKYTFEFFAQISNIYVSLDSVIEKLWSFGRVVLPCLTLFCVSVPQFVYLFWFQLGIFSMSGFFLEGANLEYQSKKREQATLTITTQNVIIQYQLLHH